MACPVFCYSEVSELNKQTRMKVVLLNRISEDARQSLGTLSVMKSDRQLFVCKTLELPWNNNQSNVSCIPAGSYPCKYTRSNRMSAEKGRDVFTYEVLNVPERAGIRIHAANYFSQLLGCIALGDANNDINRDSEPDVVHSVATVAAFEHLMNQEDFTLVITGVPPNA
jgi:hypothetical protein